MSDLIKQSLAHGVLERALRMGGDFAEIFAEDRQNNSLSMYGGVVENIVSSNGYGAGIRVLLGNRSVYVRTNDLSERGLMAAADSAAAAIAANKAELDFSFTAAEYTSPAKVRPSSVGQPQRVSVMGEAYRAAKAASSELSQIVVSLADVEQRILVANTEGVFRTDERVRTRLMVQCVAGSGNELQTGYEAPGYSLGFEVFKQRIDPEAVAVQAASTATTMLHAAECPSGVFPVVMDGGFGGVIFHEACGHSLETTSVSKGNSVFCGKLGTKIAADCVSAVDDGTLSGEWGSLNIDDEGTPTQRNVLIENGILKRYMSDILGARRMGIERSGNARRQGYEYAPTSRMTNTFIAPGSDDPDEMIATMGTGLFAKRMGGGSVNPLTGEFNFSVQEGYWVQDGKLSHPVRGGTLIGKGHDVLLKIDRVGPNMWMAAGMCGSSSGSVPTNVGQPRIRVSSMTVGGRGHQ